jgi:GxxExxY protein
VELRGRGLKAEIEAENRVLHKTVEVGYCRADLFVNDCVLVELKIAKNHSPEDEPRLLNELKATGIKVGLLVNFGRTKVEFNRMVF